MREVPTDPSGENKIKAPAKAKLPSGRIATETKPGSNVWRYYSRHANRWMYYKGNPAKIMREVTYKIPTRSKDLPVIQRGGVSKATVIIEKGKRTVTAASPEQIRKQHGIPEGVPIRRGSTIDVEKEKKQLAARQAAVKAAALKKIKESETVIGITGITPEGKRREETEIFAKKKTGEVNKVGLISTKEWERVVSPKEKPKPPVAEKPKEPKSMITDYPDVSHDIIVTDKKMPLTTQRTVTQQESEKISISEPTRKTKKAVSDVVKFSSDIYKQISPIGTDLARGIAFHLDPIFKKIGIQKGDTFVPVEEISHEKPTLTMEAPREFQTQEYKTKRDVIEFEKAVGRGVISSPFIIQSSVAAGLAPIETMEGMSYAVKHEPHIVAGEFIGTAIGLGAIGLLGEATTPKPDVSVEIEYAETVKRTHPVTKKDVSVTKASSVIKQRQPLYVGGKIDAKPTLTTGETYMISSEVGSGSFTEFVTYEKGKPIPVDISYDVTYGTSISGGKKIITYTGGLSLETPTDISAHFGRFETEKIAQINDLDYYSTIGKSFTSKRQRFSTEALTIAKHPDVTSHTGGFGPETALVVSHIEGAVKGGVKPFTAPKPPAIFPMITPKTKKKTKITPTPSLKKEEQMFPEPIGRIDISPAVSQKEFQIDEGMWPAEALEHPRFAREKPKPEYEYIVTPPGSPVPPAPQQKEAVIIDIAPTVDITPVVSTQPQVTIGESKQKERQRTRERQKVDVIERVVVIPSTTQRTHQRARQEFAVDTSTSFQVETGLKSKSKSRLAQRLKQELQMIRPTLITPGIPGITPNFKIKPSVPRPKRVRRIRRVRRKKRVKSKFEIVPLADWGAITRTEIRKKGKAHHLPAVRKVRRAYKKSWGIEFPTAEEVLGIRKKRSSKRKSKTSRRSSKRKSRRPSRNKKSFNIRLI